MTPIDISTGDNMFVTTIAAVIAWIVTEIYKRVVAKESRKARALIPLVSLALSVGGVGVYQALSGSDAALSVHTVVLGLVAFAQSIGGHSGVRELFKAYEEASKQAAATTLIAIGLGLALFSGGCSASQPASVADFIPGVGIARNKGCLQIEVEQPIPAPEGWEVETQTTIRQTPPEGQDGCGEDEGGGKEDEEPDQLSGGK